MNVRTIIVGILAVVCGLSAMFLVQALRKPPTGPVVERVSIVFAAADVKPGEVIQESMLELREIRTDEVPEDAVRKTVDALERAAMTQIDKGDMLREKKLAEKGAGRGMAALIDKGMRAFTIPTSSYSSSMAGFIQPNNHVDVLLTVNADEEEGGATTTTLLQDIRILAADTTFDAPTGNKIDPDRARSVTLQVKPEDASLLDLGQSKGTLHLSLRNSKDTGITKPRPTTLADLRIIAVKPKPAVVEAPPPPPPPMPDVVSTLPPPPPEPAYFEVRVRTLRGTSAGSDVLTFVRPAALASTNGQVASLGSGVTRTGNGPGLRVDPPGRSGGPPP
jgi:pilus assembly protein CpaB